MSGGTDPSKITIDLKALGLDGQQNNRSQTVNVSNIEPLNVETLNEGTLGLHTTRFTLDTKCSKDDSND